MNIETLLCQSAKQGHYDLPKYYFLFSRQYHLLLLFLT